MPTSIEGDVQRHGVCGSGQHASPASPMRREQPDTCADILRAILDGCSYETLADRYEVSRTVIERRAKQLAAQLCRQGLVAGVAEHHLNSAQTMRRHAAALRQALHDAPMHSGGQSRAAMVSLSEEAIDLALARLRARSPSAHRDIALLCVALSTGAWPLEVARLEVRDYLQADGCIRERSEMRAEVAVNGRARPLFFSTLRTQGALDAYLAQRLPPASPCPAARSSPALSRQGTQPNSQPDTQPAYRGLDPGSRLFLADDGQGFAVIVSEGSQGAARHLCRGIQAAYQTIFRRAGLEGITITLIRHGVAHRMARLGADLEQIGLVMGVTNKAFLKQWLKQPAPPLEVIARQLL